MMAKGGEVYGRESTVRIIKGFFGASRAPVRSTIDPKRKLLELTTGGCVPKEHALHRKVVHRMSTRMLTQNGKVNTVEVSCL